MASFPSDARGTGEAGQLGVALVVVGCGAVHEHPRPTEAVAVHVLGELTCGLLGWKCF